MRFVFVFALLTLTGQNSSKVPREGTILAQSTQTLANASASHPPAVCVGSERAYSGGQKSGAVVAQSSRADFFTQTSARAPSRQKCSSWKQLSGNNHGGQDTAMEVQQLWQHGQRITDFLWSLWAAVVRLHRQGGQLVERALAFTSKVTTQASFAAQKATRSRNSFHGAKGTSEGRQGWQTTHTTGTASSAAASASRTRGWTWTKGRECPSAATPADRGAKVASATSRPRPCRKDVPGFASKTRCSEHRPGFSAGENPAQAGLRADRGAQRTRSHSHAESYIRQQLGSIPALHRGIAATTVQGESSGYGRLCAGRDAMGIQARLGFGATCRCNHWRDSGRHHRLDRGRGGRSRKSRERSTHGRRQGDQSLRGASAMPDNGLEHSPQGCIRVGSKSSERCKGAHPQALQEKRTRGKDRRVAPLARPVCLLARSRQAVS